MPVHSDRTDVVIPAAEESKVSPCDLTVVIVNYNVCTFLEQSLDSVFRAGAGLDLQVIVVDNDSVDGSVEMVHTRFPQVELIANERNVGFARANNEAIKQARGRYIFVLNPDTIVQEDTFTTLIAFMEKHPDAGMVGCRILNPDGTFARESRRSFPTPEVAFYKVSGLSALFPKSRVFGRYNLTYLPQDQVAEVDALSGSCMFVRHDAIYTARDQMSARPSTNGLPTRVDRGGAGLLDEDFFMYGEDLDWCFRFGRAGWKVYYTPETQIIHFKGESTKQGELRYVKLFYGAMSRFVEKHFQTKYSWMFSAFLHFGIWIKATQSLLRQWLHRAKIPFLEFIAALLCVDAVALVRSVPSTFSFPNVFYMAVAPAYAAITVLSIAVVGGYSQRRINRQRPALQGVGIAFLVVATGSFFIKSVAFSRVVILFGFMAVFVVLSVLRWVRREFAERMVGQRQAVLVGPARAAERFRRLLMAQPQPPLEVVGFVELDEDPDEVRTMFSTLPRLGRVDQLRDIVRLRHIDDIVFAAGHVSNQSMFALMQQLLDLPIQFKILQPRQTQVVGKAFIGDVGLSAPLLDAEAAISLPRRRFEQKVTDALIALAAFVTFVVIAVPAFIMSPTSEWLRRLRKVGFSLPSVLAGRVSVVGFAPDSTFRPPDEWAIQIGVVPILAAERAAGLTPDQLQQVYWRYAQSQSFGLDLRIVLSYIRSTSRASLA